MYRLLSAFALHSSHFRLRIVIQSPRCGSIRQYQGVIRANPAGRNLSIAGAQSGKHSRLFAPGHEPQNPARTTENRISQRHSSPSLVESCERNICIFDLEDRVPGYE